MMKIKRKKNYVNSKELEDWWEGYLVTSDPYAWSRMSEQIYKICCGIATRFNPRSEDEYNEHVHDAFMQTMDKIKKRKLRFTRGRAPVFNLITTTVFRILYSKMNKLRKYDDHLKKYTIQTLGKDPEALAKLDYAMNERSRVHV